MALSIVSYRWRFLWARYRPSITEKSVILLVILGAEKIPKKRWFTFRKPATKQIILNSSNAEYASQAFSTMSHRRWLRP